MRASFSVYQSITLTPRTGLSDQFVHWRGKRDCEKHVRGKRFGRVLQSCRRIGLVRRKGALLSEENVNGKSVT